MNIQHRGERYLLPGVFLIAAIGLLLCIPPIASVLLGMFFQLFAFVMMIIACIQAALHKHEIIAAVCVLIALVYNPFLSVYLGYQSLFVIDYVAALFFFAAALYVSSHKTASLRKDLV